MTKASKGLEQTSSETVKSETKNSKLDREIPKERDIYPDKEQQNDPRLI